MGLPQFFFLAEVTFVKLPAVLSLFKMPNICEKNQISDDNFNDTNLSKHLNNDKELKTLNEHKNVTEQTMKDKLLPICTEVKGKKSNKMKKTFANKQNSCT